MSALNTATLLIDIDPEAEPFKVDVTFRLFPDGEVAIQSVVHEDGTQLFFDNTNRAVEQEITTQLHDLTIDQTDWFVG